MIKRAIGETLPISIATATPFEKLLNYKELHKYNSIYINVYTIIRNAHGCVDSDVDNITVSDLYESVEDDILKIRTFVDNHFGNLKLIFYSNTNNKLKSMFPYSKLFVPRTSKQINYAKLATNVFRTLKERYGSDIVEYDTTIKPHPNNSISLIVTSFCTELLSSRLFKHLVLLESHTGAIKGRLEWNTKLTNGHSLLNMPFCKFTLAIFGDNNRLLTPMSKEFRNAIKELAIKGKWTANSTSTLMRYTISNYADPHSRKQLLKLF